MKLELPRVTGPSLDDLEDAPPTLRPADGTDGQRVVDGAFADVKLHDVSYQETEFVNARIERTEFRDCRFLDVRFDGLDSPGFDAPHATWRDCEIVGSRIGVAGLWNSRLSSILIERCKIGFLNLAGSVVSDIVLSGCTVDELDLSDARATRVRFVDTAIEEVRVAGAMLSHVDLRGATLGRVTSLGSLRGAVISGAQLIDLAPGLALELGILVD